MWLVGSWASKQIRLAAFLLLSGLFLTVSPSSLLLAQTPHGLGPQEHLSREARLAALGLLTAPVDDDKIIKALSDPDWYIRGEAALAAAKLGSKIPAKDIAPLLSDQN